MPPPPHPPNKKDYIDNEINLKTITENNFSWYFKETFISCFVAKKINLFTC